MTTAEFKSRHAKTIAGLWNGVAKRYGLTEADFADRLRQWPAYVTAFDRGRGFIEVAEALLAARGA